MTKQKGNEPKQTEPRRKRGNPYRALLRGLIAHHSISVGMGAIKPDQPITKTIKMANNAEFEITVRRVKDADSAKDPWDFPKKARKQKAA